MEKPEKTERAEFIERTLAFAPYVSKRLTLLKVIEAK